MTRPSLCGIKGMILAAGFGTRMRPLSLALPKALLPVEGRSLLEWNLRLLASWGIGEVVVNAHHLAEQVLAGLRALEGEGREAEGAGSAHDGMGGRTIRPRSGDLPRIHCLPEKSILGTAGGIAQAAPLLDTDPVLIANVDLLFRPDPQEALEQHRARCDLATLLCVRDPLHAQLRLEGPRVTDIRPRPAPDDRALWGFSGIYLLSAEAVARLRSASLRSGEPAYREIGGDLRAWMAEGRLGAVRVEGRPFREAGSPEAYLELLRDAAGALREPLLGNASPAPRDREKSDRAPARPPTAAPRGYGFAEDAASIEPGAVLEECAIFAGAVVKAGTRVTRSLLGPGSVSEGSAERVVRASGESRPLALLPGEEERRLDAWLRSRKAQGLPLDLSTPPRFRSLHGGGSSRRIVRLLLTGESRILAVYPPAEALEDTIYPRRREADTPSELASFLYVGDCLRRAGVPVPRVEATADDCVLMEDLGDRLLADEVAAARSADGSGEGQDEGTVELPQSGSSRLRGLYKEAIGLLLRMQDGIVSFDPARTHNPPYDVSFIAGYESGYFHREMVASLCGLDTPIGQMAPVYEELARASLAEAPPVFMHRDYQSRNLMVTSRGLVVIDYQGARIGPPEYDLASLLLDPYVRLPRDLRDELLEEYINRRLAVRRLASETNDGPVAARILRRYRACAINRLLQALGAFAYLGGRLGKPGFLEHAPAALEHLREMAGTGQGIFRGVNEPPRDEILELVDLVGQRLRDRA